MLRVVALALVAAASSAAADANPRPVVGILVQPLQPDVASDQPLLRYGSMYLPASYVKLVEAAGARVAPVFYNSTAAQLKAKFEERLEEAATTACFQSVTVPTSSLKQIHGHSSRRKSSTQQDLRRPSLP